jgi:hypothetical protein
MRPSDPPRPSGKSAPIGDVRAEFERLTRSATRDREAERAFIRKRIQLISDAPGLTDEERAAAIAELQRLLDE